MAASSYQESCFSSSNRNCRSPCVSLSSLPRDRGIRSEPGIAAQGKGQGFLTLRDGEMVELIRSPTGEEYVDYGSFP